MSLYLLVFWPVFTALAIYLIPKCKSMRAHETIICDAFALIGSATEFLLCAFLMTEDLSCTMLKLGRLTISFRFGGLNAILVLIASFAWICSICFMDKSIKSRVNCFFVFLTEACLTGVLLADDYFTLFLYASLCMLFAYPIVGSKTRRGKIAYFVTLLVCSVSLLCAMILLLRHLGTLSYQAIYTLSGLTDPQLMLRIGLLLALGSGFLTLFPAFHMMLRSMSDVGASHGLLFGSMMSKAGLTILLSLSARMLSGSQRWHDILIVLGMMLMLGSAGYALFNHNIKRIYAGVSLTQTGIILIALSDFTLSGAPESCGAAALHMIVSALLETTFFGALCIVIRQSKTIWMDEICGFGRNKPVLNAVFLLTSLSFSGIPFLSGYISRLLVFLRIQSYISYTALYVLSGAMISACMIRVYVTLFIEKSDRMPPDEGMDPFSAAALLIPTTLSPLLGIFTDQLTVPMLSYILRRIYINGGGKFTGMYFYSGEYLLVALITLLLGILLCWYTCRAFQRHKNDFQKEL